MRKIESVRLKNFQSHEDTQISFDDYNVIYGSTNSGKSAIIRGIKWALYNLPPAEGVDFRRFGTKETLVTIVFNDGRKITRRRTAKENEYILETADGTKNSYSQFGRGPLKEVMDFHGMYQVNLFGNPQSVNIVDQSEPPFFLSQGPTARGHLISRLAGTLLYESALSLMRKGVNEYSKEIDKKTETLESLNKTVEDLSYVPSLKEFLEYAEAVDSKANRDADEKELINSLLTRIQASSEARDSNIKKAEFVESFNSAQDAVSSAYENLQDITRINHYRNALTQHFELWNAQRQYPFSQDDINIVSAKLLAILSEMNIVQSLNMMRDTLESHREKLAEANYKLSVNEKHESLVTTAVNEVEQRNFYLSDISNKYWNIHTYRQKFASKRDEINEINNKIKVAENNYKSALLEAGVCPTCSQLIDEKVLEGIEV